MKFCSLYSGSSGNSLFIQGNETKILVDSGVSAKKITEGLDSINIDIKEINAILVTHEHIDHIRSLGTIAKKYNIPIYASLGTWNGIDNEKSVIKINEKNYFKIGEKFEIGELKIMPFSTSHDAMDPCGFSIEHDERKISIATDLGEITSEVISNLKQSKFVLLESNYEPEVLKLCSYPYSVKSRIASTKGHLSNKDAGNTISKLIDYGLQNVMLGHLSKESNFPELAYKSVVNELMQNGINIKDIELNVADRL
ncbi:MAG: MBL fold metallo-hydrolase, partial [Clostridia bacterium]|nr:MBL fold metallo-hydrolase [Clostridia bacterium]